MELELNKKKSEYFKCIYSGSAMHEENTEMIVPDQSPDVMRIVNGRANVFLKDKNARKGKVDISGSINGAVVYIAEGESNIRRLPVLIPFAYVFDNNEITEDSKIMAEVHLRGFEVREINPRKISVRANVEVYISVYEKSLAELCEGVSECEKFGMCIKKRSISRHIPVCMCEKNFTISDDIELGNVESGMQQIVFSSVNLVPTDTKVIGNKAIVKGNAEISYVFMLEDGSLESCEHELPFSQIIDLECMEDSNDLKIKISLLGFELEPQYDVAGKARYISVSISADALAVVYATENVEVIDDAYSTKHDIAINRGTTRCSKLCDKSEKRVAVSETIEAGVGIKRVLDVSVDLSPPSRRREEGGEVLVSDAVISAMYLSEDDSIYSASRKSAVVCPMPLNEMHRYDTNMHIKGKSYSVGANNDINVRFFTDFDVSEIEEESIEVISGIKLDAEIVEDRRGMPGVTVKRLERDYDIWTLAKEYSTTVEEIKLANNITEEIRLSMGRMVLIPHKK